MSVSVPVFVFFYGKRESEKLGSNAGYEDYLNYHPVDSPGTKNKGKVRKVW